MNSVLTFPKRIARCVKRAFQARPYHPTILSYSEGHFRPNQTTPRDRTFYTSAAQIANHLHQVFIEQGPVLYSDEPGIVRTDLLFATDTWLRCRNVKAKMTIVFPAVAHLRYTRDQLLSHQDLCTQGHPERLDDENVVTSFENALQEASKIIVIGNDVIRSTFSRYGVSENKLTMMNYGIDADHFTPQRREESEPVFIHPTTTLCLRKGFPFLAKAWKLVKDRLPDSRAKLILLGADGDSSGYLEMDLPDVEVVGKYVCGSEEHCNLMNRAHYVVFPSLSEGQAGTVLEAMSCGCVPIITPETGIDADNYGGLSVSAACVQSLASALEQTVKSHTATQWDHQTKLCREEILKAHRWSDFQSRIGAICFGSTLGSDRSF